MEYSGGYRRLSEFLRKTCGTRVRKICIDGGFSCPNRDGTCGVGGCIFCGERGAGEHIASGMTITQQVTRELERRAAKRGDLDSANNLNSSADGDHTSLTDTRHTEKYIAYFQNFSGTYADVATLRERYDAALIDERIVMLAIGTRPDCIDEKIAELLAEYRERRGLRVWIELGLQTASDVTARRIHRGYPSARFTEAVDILNRYGIDVVVHLMIGLPGENFANLEHSVAFVNRHRLWGIKLHSLYIMDGTELATIWRRGEFESITMDEYIERAVYVLTHIDPELIVHRLTGDCPTGQLVAPAWNTQKTEILRRMNEAMAKTPQGCHFDRNTNGTH